MQVVPTGHKSRQVLINALTVHLGTKPQLSDFPN